MIEDSLTQVRELARSHVAHSHALARQALEAASLSHDVLSRATRKGLDLAAEQAQSLCSAYPSGWMHLPAAQAAYATQLQALLREASQEMAALAQRQAHAAEQGAQQLRSQGDVVLKAWEASLANAPLALEPVAKVFQQATRLAKDAMAQTEQAAKAASAMGEAAAKAVQAEAPSAARAAGSRPARASRPGKAR